MADDTPSETGPAADDIRLDDQTYNPAVEPKKAKAWLNLLAESEKAFEKWNDHCDKIDKQFASLERLSNMARDKEYQMFWANMEVIKPSIYAKPPQPVVVPKFKDRRPVPQAASEIMERCAIVAFDLTRINDTMLLIRDDVAMISRGVAWCRYEEGGDGEGSYYDHEKVCIEFKHRRDFLHSISRCWYEVTWVAAAAYMTRGEARKRFHATSKDEYQNAEYKVDKDSKDVGGADKRERAKFWEIWHKTEKRVVWVAEGCENILDEDDPHLDLQNFFPCPKPAYASVQRGSLVPVPEVLQYKDQLEEINLLTGRIHALSDALEAKGFYPAGGAELSDAVQAAIKIKSPGRLLVPISNWAAFGGSKEVIIWLPIDMIAQTITALVALRKQVTDDIYQITGLSDIMRGQTDPGETLGAVELKTDYGSVRIRDKQQELARLARDLVEITAEIITEKFDPVTIIEMSQTQLPTQDLIRKQIANIQQQMQAQQQQAEQLMQSPQIQQMAKQNPQAGQQAMQQFQQVQQGANQAIQKLAEKPTIEQVLQFMKNQRTKSFVLDIETDSTIQADENAEKQRRTEFVGVLSTLLPQLSMMITAEPQTASFCGELLKFATAPFRAGRTLDGAIDDLVQQMEQKGNQDQSNNNPAQINAKTALQIENMKQETERQKISQEGQIAQQQMAQKDRHKQADINAQFALKQVDQGMSSQDAQAKLAVQNQKLLESREAHQMEMAGKQQDMALNQQKADASIQAHNAKLTDMSMRQEDRRSQQQFQMTRQATAVPGGRRG
jgi:hypothetical protein